MSFMKRTPWKTAALALLCGGLLLLGLFLRPGHTSSEKGYLRAADAAIVPEAQILVVGDLFFDRFIRRTGEVQGDDFLFSCITPILQTGDFAVGNLEGPITDNPSKSLGTIVGSPENYVFTFPTTTAALLLRNNIRIVNLGNNHIDNFGSDGISSTHHYLERAGVDYFGGIAGDEPVYRTDDVGIPLSFVGYNQFGGSAPQEVAKTIAAESALGREVIVFAHWGTEYSRDTSSIRPIAALFAQSGAKAIIGSHPHIILPHEYIGDTLVYYSLGNFMFDQYWNDDVRRGLAVLLHIQGGRVTAEEYPTFLQEDGRTCPAPLHEETLP